MGSVKHEITLLIDDLLRSEYTFRRIVEAKYKSAPQDGHSMMIRYGEDKSSIILTIGDETVTVSIS